MTPLLHCQCAAYRCVWTKLSPPKGATASRPGPGSWSPRSRRSPRSAISRQASAISPRALAKWLGPPNGHARAVQISMLAISYILFTRQVPLLAADGEADRDLTRRMAETIQAIVDEGIPFED